MARQKIKKRSVKPALRRSENTIAGNVEAAKEITAASAAMVKQLLWRIRIECPNCHYQEFATMASTGRPKVGETTQRACGSKECKNKGLMKVTVVYGVLG